ncbi:MAG: hypothetical protein J7647_10720 [Cyanobacteria bacterium SBLK]|nr:hypothetical protein [Cyanobacteria bacterium SBLK]
MLPSEGAGEAGGASEASGVASSKFGQLSGFEIKTPSENISASKKHC